MHHERAKQTTVHSRFELVALPQLDAERARKEARARSPPPDQFAQSKMKAEIANPYKQNWILVISIAIGESRAYGVSLAFNPRLFSGASIFSFISF